MAKRFIHKRIKSSIDAGERDEALDLNTLDQDLAGEVDLRAEIKDIFDNYGHWAYLRRASDQKCNCWNPVTREADPRCPHCTGEGWAYRDKKTRIRKMPLSDLTTRTILQQVTGIGEFGVSQYVIWVEWDLNPSDRDSIIEVKLDSDQEIAIPQDIETVWDIALVHPFRGNKGRIEYWACYVAERGVGK